MSRPVLRPLDSDPPWLKAAWAELGVRETPGAAHTDRVLEYLATCHVDNGGNIKDYGAHRDETAWCSAFATFAMLEGGIAMHERSAWAKWWLTAPGFEACNSRRGAIVVFPRGARNGHVAIELGTYAGAVFHLGGNQRNRVCVTTSPAGAALGRRWPVQAPAASKASGQGRKADKRPVLRLGSKGAWVETLQRALRAAGATTLRVDAQFGPKTERAVKVFQEIRDLQDDGVVGKKTWGVLAVAARGMSRVPPCP